MARGRDGRSAGDLVRLPPIATAPVLHGPPMQLDLFADSRDVMLRNGLVDALRRRNLPAGRKARGRLAAQHPQDALLGPADVLLRAIGRRIRPFANPAAAQQAASHLGAAVRPAAALVFGAARADEWLTPLWLTLAEAVAGLPYCPDAPEAHAARLLMRARQWHHARVAAEAIPSWRHIPQALAWMSEISFELDGLESAWPLLAELAWLQPEGFAAVARSLASPSLARLLREFDRDFVTGDDSGFAWFPAWALIAEPSLESVLRNARTPIQGAPEQAAHTALQLLSLERQGRHPEVIVKRKTLRGLHEALFHRYMATRA